MKIYKPTYVNHDERPIFSLDIHPDGTRFATGGQGNESSGLVRIWNLAPVLSAEVEADKTIPKMLCQMDNHISCVNSVRWSMSGLMLASGGDDKTIMIWKRGKGSGGGVFGSSGITKNAENWRCVTTLTGHSGDVLDLAWSPQDQWLASCSVDNTIIIWDVQALSTIVARLKGHTGLVKGVTWDPVGKFLASQSDDRSIKLWKTSDWSCQTTVTDPFDECGGTTHVLRLSWSPDGLYLVSAHAMNGGGPTAQIIEREGWKCDKDFVGHRKAVTCVRFHNSILKRQAHESKKSQQYCCVAVGSRDRSLSVWMTALQRPLVVIHDLFEDSVLDMSWSAQGYILMACSVDGTVVSLQFSAEELGTPLSEDDKNSLYQRMYGKSSFIDLNVQACKDMIIENADLLNASQEKIRPPSLITQVEKNSVRCDLSSRPLMAPPNNNNNSFLEPQSQSPVVPVTPIHKQIETKTADGKRRITPMFIPSNIDADETTPEFSSSSRKQSSIVVEKITINANTTTMENNTMQNKVFNSFATPNSSNPQQISTNGIGTSTSNQIESLQVDSRVKKVIPTEAQLSKIDVNTAVVKAQQQPNIAKFDQIAVVTKPLATTGGKAVPLKGSFIKSAGELRVQVVNGNLKTPFGQLGKVCCFHMQSPTKKIWENYIGSPIVNFSCCLKYVLLCSLDGTIQFLNVNTGIIILPVLNLITPAVLSSFSFNSQLGGVLTECGSVRIWNIDTQSIFITTSCCDLLKGGYPHTLSITEHGYPFISITNGCSYSYSKKLDSWMVLNSKDPIVRYGLSDTSSSPSNMSKNMKVYPLMSYQTISHVFKPAGQNFDLSANAWQHSAKQSFIENQIELCKTINSPVELKHWYSMLGYHLSQHGTEIRIRLLLDDLLGPVHLSSVSLMSSSSTNSKQHEILGIDKHDLLGDILIYFKSKLEWQRLWTEYSEQLIMLKKIQLENNTMDTS